MLEWFIFALIGVVTGLFAGLLGLGGGLIIVPALLFVFSWQGLAEAHLMHLAVGTSLTTITLTSLSSMYAHQQQLNVNWSLVERLVPGLIIGGFMGAYFATMLTSQFLQQTFALYMLFVAIRMWLPITNYSDELLVNKVTLLGVGGIVGSISALVGIGGGSLLTPYLLMAKQSMQRAIGTSAACGFPISIAAVIGFLLFGQEQNVSNDWQTGFIHWQAFLGIISTSIVFAIIGAQLTQYLPVEILKRLFSVVLIIGGIYLI
ncbi:MAG: sulfite exporter TauE/SafE family protein [Piscirickettsiaceae bacterium]|nr:sulfite exporter TauE/SafE family protein [Piscirickettsiaceae bacterium]